MTPQSIPYDLELDQTSPTSQVVDTWSDNGIGGGDCVGPEDGFHFQVDAADATAGQFKLQLWAFIRDQTYFVTLSATVSFE
jgi:hypothetical protein